jgi:hypothetical protein
MPSQMALFLYRRSGEPAFYIDRGTIYSLPPNVAPRTRIVGSAAFDNTGAAIFEISDVYFKEAGSDGPPLHFDPREID